MFSERFHETQRFRQPWLWLVTIAALLLPLAIIGFGLWQQLVLGKPFGDQPASDGVLIAVFALVVAIALGVLVLFTFARLDVSVDNREVLIRFRPFHINGRRIALSEIAEARARTYRPIVEYGGWGIRYGFFGVAYNVSGNEGVQLVLADGRRVLIGSQRSRELEAAITSSRLIPR